MAGFRLTDGSGGCPPTATPPSGYQNPFRFDSAGKLWITGCFKGFQYFGAARHDIGGGKPGTTGFAVTSASPYYTGSGWTGGTRKSQTITNTTNCTMGFLLAHDMIIDLTMYEDRYAIVYLTEKWNGVYHSHAAISNKYIAGGTSYCRQYLHNSASPHDVGADASGGSTLQLAPGASATVSAQFYMVYGTGSPAVNDYVNSASSAVRIYGYVLG